MRTAELARFIEERYRIYLRRKTGYRKPWTSDPILQQFRFCNAYRELDKVTIWIRENWRELNATDPDLWFAMVVARKVNWPDSLAEIGFPVPWRRRKFVETLAARRSRGEKMESSAYMITAGRGPQWVGVPKYVFLAEAVLTPLWRRRATLRPTRQDTLATFHARLKAAGYTLGGFLAAQIVADVKNTEGQALAEAKDWWTWAASGPGSKRGLNRVCERPTKAPWKEAEWLATLRQLRRELAPLLRSASMPRMCAQDTQNCLCEYDKYERVRLGEGRPKQLYPGSV